MKITNIRKLIVCISLLSVATLVHSQEPAPSQPLTKQDYLQKSKNQKTAAWILFGAGAAMVGIAAPGNVSFDILPVLAIGGSASIIGSIPLFIAAGKSKKRANAMTTYFNVQQIPLATYKRPSNRSFPSISVRWNF